MSKDVESQTTNNVVHDEEKDVPDSIRGKILTLQRIIDECPPGYPQLAAYLSASNDTLIFRDFNYLRCRLLLEQQHQLSTLEDELGNIDRRDALGNSQEQSYLRNRALDTGRPSTGRYRSRSQVFEDIYGRLKQYDQILTTTREMTAWVHPSPRTYLGVRNWFHNNNPLGIPDADYIKRHEELISLRYGESETFEGRIQWWLYKLKCRAVKRMFSSTVQESKTSNPHTLFFSAKRISNLVSIFIISLTSGLLILPVVILYKLRQISQASKDKGSGGGQDGASGPISIGELMIVIGFTVIFCATMAGITSARRQDLFAGTAAYCAVLVVFIGNI